MEKRISIVIPNYNKADTIGECLRAAFASTYGDFEVIVVDDHSRDGSVELIKQFPCKLICLEKRSGTSKARNVGAQNSSGEVIFFIDADCLLLEDTLSIVNKTLSETDSSTVIGGTYTKIPYDKGFFNIFQSVFVNYFETKNNENPDYIAAHAMIMNARTFRKSGGFPEDFLPIIEDVEFSHRLRKSGCSLVMNPRIQVRHIFGFSLIRSLRNAFRKTFYWNLYSLKNRDVFVDSGCASAELKTNVASYCLIVLFLLLWGLIHKHGFLFLAACTLTINMFINRRLLRFFFETKGSLFAGLATLYYMLLYPLPISMGTASALMKHFFTFKKLGTASALMKHFFALKK